MAVYHGFLALESDYQRVVDWFLALDHERTLAENPEGLILYFRGMAQGALPASG